MALIRFTAGVNSAHRVERWAKQLWHTHQRDQFFGPFTGKDSNSIIQLKANLATQAGFQMTEGLIMPFDSEGVTGDQILEENEEAPEFHTIIQIVAYYCKVVWKNYANCWKILEVQPATT